MARVSCLAGVNREKVPDFAILLKAAGFSKPAIVDRLDVVVIGKLKPDILVCDIDDFSVDALEFLRQLRFVIPSCLIFVYTAVMARDWSVECHLAGANGMLAKDSTNARLAAGVRSAIRTGCFTDPRFSAASRPRSGASA